jgi:hypothetical protein
MGAPDRTPSDPAISRHDAPSGVRRRSLPEHDTPTRSIETNIGLIFILMREETLGPSSLFTSIQQSSYHRPVPSKGTTSGESRSCTRSLWWRMVMLQPNELGSRGLLGATTRSRRHATQRRLDHQKDSVAAVVLALDHRNELERD